MTLKQLHQQLLSLQIMYGKNLEVLQLEVIYELEDEVVEANKAQLFEGKKSDGSNMPPYANKPGKVRLYDKGFFYQGFFVKRTGSFPIVIDSGDDKRDMLVARYGEQIFGLDKIALAELVKDHILPAFIKKIKNELDLS
jgi:hypothetical protein